MASCLLFLMYWICLGVKQPVVSDAKKLSKFKKGRFPFSLFVMPWFNHVSSLWQAGDRVIVSGGEMNNLTGRVRDIVNEANEPIVYLTADDLSIKVLS